jgi:hypothetical protein
MKTILPTFVGILLLAFFGIGPTDQADAASTKQRGYTTYCHGTPDQCMRRYGYRAARPTTRQAPGAYLPARRSGGEYDFPRFGSERWWQLQEDRD